MKLHILPLPNSKSLIRGHWGLGDPVSLHGIVRIERKSERDTSRILSVRLKLEGKIYTSNGDSRNHSAYESSIFLTLGPEEYFALPKTVQNSFESGAGSSRKTKDNEIATTSADDGGDGYDTDDISHEYMDVKFIMNVASGSGDRLHASLAASDPEWGFGARIEYTLTASVITDTTLSSRMAIPDLMSRTAALYSAQAPAGSTNGARAPTILGLFLSKPIQTTVSQSTKLVTASLLTQTYKTCMVIPFIRYTPAALLRGAHMKDLATATDFNPSPRGILPHMPTHVWSSKTDRLPEDPLERQSALLITYQATLGATAFGPGDAVPLSFWVKPREKEIKQVLVKVSLEETQGVGVEIQKRGRHNAAAHGVREDTKYLDDLREMMEGTSLGRKFMALDIAVWEAKEKTIGEFSDEQKILLQIPPLAAMLPKPTLFGTKYNGVNPSGNYANRVQIDHKLKVSITLITPNGNSLPPINLESVNVHINGFNETEAKHVIQQVPRLCRDTIEIEKFAPRPVQSVPSNIKPIDHPLRRRHGFTASEHMTALSHQQKGLSEVTLVEASADGAVINE